ncbi:MULTISPECIES: CpaE family protein [unclassified Microbacterium]|uniref:AAA family ATPase n=1 Tax=unclassified Microbacterium TaxID=2609290 RepID=UPI00386E10AE
MRVVVAVDGRRAEQLADDLRDEDAEVVAVVPAGRPAAAVIDALSRPDAAETLAELSRADILILQVSGGSLTSELVDACDRFAVRIVPLCERGGDRRLAASLGLAPRGIDDRVADLLGAPPPREAAPPGRGRVIAVWGPHGAPGRTTLAIELACALATGERRVALVDADTHAPSVALATGLADEGPGFAAACRQAERGLLTIAELTRIASTLGEVDVLTGLNRPGRWPELSHTRVRDALEACRTWVDDTVVDVAASLERDEEIVSDIIDGPRRNAATLATLESADLVVAVAAADPVGIARFVRDWPELRAATGTTPVKVLVNKTRAGALGVDARGQVRRTLERFTGVSDVSFVPWDARGADAAMLAARPLAHVAPRAALAAAVRRLAAEVLTSAGVREAPISRAAVRRRLTRTA